MLTGILHSLLLISVSASTGPALHVSWGLQAGPQVCMATFSYKGSGPVLPFGHEASTKLFTLALTLYSHSCLQLSSTRDDRCPPRWAGSEGFPSITGRDDHHAGLEVKVFQPKGRLRQSQCLHTAASYVKTQDEKHKRSGQSGSSQEAKGELLWMSG